MAGHDSASRAPGAKGVRVGAGGVTEGRHGEDERVHGFVPHWLAGNLSHLVGDLHLIF